MLWWWLWVWIVFVIFLILLPLGYGWGYRGWGPPYPRYRYRGRRGDIVEYEEIEEPPGRRSEPPARGWGVVADLLWLAALGAIVWVIVWAWT